jgi:hypothetical protein
MALVTIVALVVVAYLLIVMRKDRGEGEVLLQPATSEGPSPFTRSVVPAGVPTSLPKPQSGTSTLPPAAPTVADSRGGLKPVAGDQPGLYGGSNELGVCDKEKLITFLEQNPAKRAAFAGVLGISDVRKYVESLSPVILTADTRVTNHGFENGRATPFQSVLQAGTAVLVDDRGVPRVRCACGNPLLPPVLAKSKPKYTGDSWPRFDPGRIIVIQPTKAPITQITVINIITGGPLVINIQVTVGLQQTPPSATTPPTTTPSIDLTLIDGSYALDAATSDCFTFVDALNIRHNGSQLAIDFYKGLGKMSGVVASDGSFTAKGRYDVGGGVALSMEGVFVVEGRQYVMRGTLAFGPPKPCSRDFTGKKT